MAALFLALLGPFHASLGGEALEDGFPTNKARAMLAWLAVEADRPHQRDAIAGLLWPDKPDRDALRNVRKALHRLRTTLEDARPGLSDELLTVTRQTIQLHSGAIDLDVTTFEAALAASERHSHPSLAACPSCLAQLTQAVELVRGEFLAGFSLPDAEPFEEWLRLHREAHHHQHLSSLFALADAHEQRGEYERAYDYAARQLALEPWREEAHRQLMRALARSGQRTEALAQYDACRRVLDDELGVEPSEATQALREQIATGQLDVMAPITPTLTVRRHGFPAQVTPFFGREQELAHLLAGLTDPACRLLTLSGPGGVGKTRLSIEAAARLGRETNLFPDGIFFVPLSAVASPTLLPATIAEALGLPLPSDDARPLLDALQPRALLLVLDNFERVRAGAEFLAELLAAAPEVKLLVTSREPLYLRAEQRLPLDGLVYPETDTPDVLETPAVALFMQAATRVQPDFTLDPPRQAAVVRICQSVRGLPLALEIAAAWVRLYDCTTIADKISQNLDFLVSPLRDVPARHRSLRAVFDYSWALLTPAEQAALAQASIFRGDFSLPAALAITDAHPLDLSTLLDKSLLRRNARGRYELHELLRQFAAEHLADSPDEARVRAAHAAYYVRLLHRLADTLKGGEQLAALAEIAADLDNVRAAWAHSIVAGNVAAVGEALESLFHFYDIRSRFREGELLFRQATEQLPIDPHNAEHRIVQAKLQARQGWFAFHVGQLEQSRALLSASLERLQALNAEREMVFSLNYLGAVMRHVGQHTTAHHYLASALRIAQAVDDSFGASISLNMLGQMALLQGDYATARLLCQQSLDLKQTIGDRWGMAFSFSYLGRVAHLTGNHEEARALFEESLALCRAFGDRRGIAYALQNQGDAARALGDWDDARARYAASLELYEEIGSRQEASLTRIKLATVAIDHQAWAAARTHLRRALRDALALNSPPVMLNALLSTARLLAQTDRAARARDLLAFVVQSPETTLVQQMRAETLWDSVAPSAPLPPPTVDSPPLRAFVTALLADL